MRNIMEINGYKAVIAYDPETELFRGEFLGLNGGADFYADNVAQLKQEGELSLKIFFEMCEEKGIEPFKQYSGKFNIRLSPELHKAAALAATAENLSLNEWISRTLEKSV
ncbi:type II toxin-antitoxin system HicB family antitoxin [Mannheimia varigena]|uniref:HicB-related protein n=1 Tax=Mannheimia varigena USDA-ARS-USMARC-1296 TaxID=1433287 RepID=W0QCV8_9PAST|nr:type II toxin-antitoxin system HicB family antitoxin [Mannheimia varigena]AHG75068.1 HicB-related protein [Mannheimia varigena USDA-ARS-USMARC-1296]AWW34264.1 type II toxin-antitoxin system HicB family antitoxin [Mannheimia varigena]TLU75200.1 type II toxin-antitoxin system HicB family antitoxin [Mannheimia varigena]